MKVPGKWKILWCAGAVSIALWLTAAEEQAAEKDFSEQLQQELKLEESLFALEVKGDAGEAIRLLLPIEQRLVEDPGVRFQYWLLRMRAQLALGSVSQARVCYQRMRTEVSRESDARAWLELAKVWIPDDFIEREVPWKDGQLLVFEWSREDDEKTHVSGYDLIAVSVVEDGQGVELWRLNGCSLGESKWTYELLLDRRTLQIRSTQLHSEPISEVLMKVLARDATEPVFFPAGGSENIETGNSVSWLLRGMLLQQCSFALGLEQTLELYDLESGLSETTKVSVLSVQLIDGGDQGRVPCWVAKLNSEAGQREYFFENEDSSRLIQYYDGLMTAVLNKSTHLSKLDHAYFTESGSIDWNDALLLSLLNPESEGER